MNIKVINTVTARFDSIEPGTAFESDNHYYIKLRSAAPECNAVNIKHGTLALFDDYNIVKPYYNAEVTLR